MTPRPRMNLSTLTRAVRAADSSAVPRVVEIDAAGTIRLVPVNSNDQAAGNKPARPGHVNEWDEVLPCG
jgi:hypothetical protein